MAKPYMVSIATLILVCASSWAQAFSLLDGSINFIQTAERHAFLTSAPGNSHGHESTASHKESDDILGRDCDGGHAVAMGLMSASIIVPCVLYMALSEGPAADLIVRMIDTFISLFLAMLWFNAFSCVLRLQSLRSTIPYAEEVYSFVMALVLYLIVIIFAYYWRDKDNQLMILCGCGAHYIAFAGIRVTGEAQHEAAKDHKPHLGPWVSLLVVVISFLFIMACSSVTHYFCRGRWKNRNFSFAVEEMELDIIGLVISFAITQTLQQAVLGYYPANIHFLQMDAGIHHSFMQGSDIHPSELQCFVVLAWSITLTIVAAVLITHLDDMTDSEMSCISRTARIAKVILVMCIAWGYLLWGKWQFHDGFFRGHPMFGSMFFAVVATLASLFLILVLSTLHLEDHKVMESVGITLMGASLVVAWSWEHAFNAAINVVAERYDVGYGGLVPKFIMASVIPLFMMPFYVKHLKPKVIKIQEEERESRRATLEDRRRRHSEAVPPTHTLLAEGEPVVQRSHTSPTLGLSTTSDTWQVLLPGAFEARRWATTNMPHFEDERRQMSTSSGSEVGIPTMSPSSSDPRISMPALRIRDIEQANQVVGLTRSASFH